MASDDRTPLHLQKGRTEPMFHKRKRRASDAPSFSNPFRIRVNETASEEQAETRMNRWLDSSLPFDGRADARDGDAIDAMSHLSPTAQEKTRPTRTSSPARPHTPTSAAREHETWKVKGPWPPNPSTNHEEDQASSPHSSDMHMTWSLVWGDPVETPTPEPKPDERVPIATASQEEDESETEPEDDTDDLEFDANHVIGTWLKEIRPEEESRRQLLETSYQKQSKQLEEILELRKQLMESETKRHELAKELLRKDHVYRMASSMVIERIKCKFSKEELEDRGFYA